MQHVPNRTLPLVLAGLLSAASAWAQLDASGAQLLSAQLPGLPAGGDPLDGLGSSLAAGDFDGHGVDDLAIGIPFADQNGGTASDAGEVLVFYGSASGLATDTAQAFSQESPGMSGLSQDGDLFAGSLAAGDFDGDDRDDLAVGSPGESVGAADGAGGLWLIPGSAGGLTSVGHQAFSQDSPGMGDSAETGDGFASSLAVGDFDGNGVEDLAVGSPFEDIRNLAAGGDQVDAGAIHVLYGSGTGLSGSGSLFLHRSTAGVNTQGGSGAQTAERFGFSLAAGDLRGDGADDLAVGAPGQISSFELNAGAVQLLPGLIGIGIDTGEDTSEAFSVGYDDRELGFAVAIADYNGDGFDDAVGGAPGWSTDDVLVEREGRLFALRSGGDVFPTIDCTGTDGSPEDAKEPFDRFGKVLARADFDRDGLDEVVVGVPDENLDDAEPNPKLDAGNVQVLEGAPISCGVTGRQAWSLDSPGVPGVAVANDRFGEALAVGDFDGNGFDDLAVGIPHYDAAAVDDGAVLVLYNLGVFYDGFESGGASAWGSTLP